MAHGYYRVSGKPAVVMVHVTVGTANTVCALMNAARDNVPVILGAGRTPLTETGHQASRNRSIHWGQEMFDQGSLVREFVKWDYELRAGQPVDSIVDRALDIAMSEPRGPVYLTLPREVLCDAAVAAAAQWRAAARRQFRGAVARRDRGSGGAPRQGGVSADPDLLGRPHRRGDGRAYGTRRGLCPAGGAVGGARREPLRPRIRCVSASTLRRISARPT